MGVASLTSRARHGGADAFKKNALDWERRFEIILGTAEGLSYLHNASEIRIIHRDIKASNILLDERFRARLVL